jgi:hypothetical protein
MQITQLNKFKKNQDNANADSTTISNKEKIYVDNPFLAKMIDFVFLSK